MEAAGSWKLGWWKARTASGSRLRLASRASPTPHEYGESGAPAWVHLVHRGRGPERRRRRRPSVQYSAWDHGSTAHRRRRRAESEKPDARRHAHAPTQAARRAQATKALCRPWRALTDWAAKALEGKKHVYVARIHKFAHKNKLLCLLPKHMSATTRCQQRRYRHLFAVHIHSLMHRAIRRQQKNSKTKEKDMHHIPSAQRRQDVYYHSSTMEREKDVP